MPGIIRTAPAASGKTASVIDDILQMQGFGQEVWVLLPTQLQIDAFRERLLHRAAQLGRRSVFNVRLFNFYDLYAHLLDLAGSPQRTIEKAATDRILRQILGDLRRRGKLIYYTHIADRPGFVAMVSGFIQELKQGIVPLEDFKAVADKPPNKDRDLALIYEHYQDFLYTNELVDRDGAGWVALELIEKRPQLVQHVTLLAVDGYDQFTPLQAHLLAALSRGVRSTLITLTYEAHRRDDACRTFARTLERLEQVGGWRQEPHPLHPPHVWGGDQGVGLRVKSLAHLEQHLFSTLPPQHPAEDHLTVIEAPDARTEARAVMREIKRLLLEGTSPESILVVMRDSDPYADAIRSAAAAYDLPVLIRQAEGVLVNPAVATVLSLLDLHQHDFPRRILLDVLRSPYLTAPDFTGDQIARLEQLSMERIIVGGRQGWLHGLDSTPTQNEDGELIAPPEDLPILRGAVANFFDRVTPPEQASAREYVAWIENLLGTDPAYEAQETPPLYPLPMHGEGAGGGVLPSLEGGGGEVSFSIYHNLRADAEPLLVVRDLYAMLALRAVLKEVLAAYDLMADTTNQGISLIIPWKDFRNDLEIALKQRSVQVGDKGSRIGRVLVTTIFEARGLSHDYVFILGLSEGIFPAQQQEDPLYSDRERAELERSGIDVQTSAERSSDQGLFYEMCALARAHLTLSRPTIDQGGNPWSASIFWKSVLAILPDPREIKLKLGVAPTLQEAANLREVAVSLSQQLCQPPEKIAPEAWGAIQWINQQSLWQTVQRGHEIERRRESYQHPFDGYSGILHTARLIEEAAKQLNPQRIWSATQLNELAMCGFRFFSKRLLRLEKYEEPEEGLDATQLGSVNHAILENTYRRMEGIPITLDNLEEALSTLEEEAIRVFATAPQQFGFRVTPLWEQEKHNMLVRLRAIVTLDFSSENPFEVSDGRVPFRMEAAFGANGELPVILDGASGMILAKGFIDRIDLINAHDLIITDYKSGTPPSRKDVQEGRNYQMLLYIRAVQQLMAHWDMDYVVRGGFFWSLRDGKDSGMITQNDLEYAENRLHQIIVEARQGAFPSKPAKMTSEGKCAHYCEYSQFCRVNRASKYKELHLE